jgi:hypothetical protein
MVQAAGRYAGSAMLYGWLHYTKGWKSCKKYLYEWLTKYLETNAGRCFQIGTLL